MAKAIRLGQDIRIHTVVVFSAIISKVLSLKSYEPKPTHTAWQKQ